MLFHKFTVTAGPFNYEFVSLSHQLIITATNKKYFEWSLDIGPSQQFELLTREIISDIFYDFSLNQLSDNTKIIFPESCEKRTASLSIAIVNTMFLHKQTINKTTMLTLAHKPVLMKTRIPKIMKDIYVESSSIFKKNVVDMLKQIHSEYDTHYNVITSETNCNIDLTIDNTISDMKQIMKIKYDKLRTEFQKELINNLQAVDYIWTNNSTIKCAIDCTRNNDPEEFVEYITWFINSDAYCIMSSAVVDNQFAIFTWFAVNKKEYCTQSIFNFAARTGRLNMIQFLCSDLMCQTWDIHEAIVLGRDNGHDHIVDWLTSRL